MKTLIFVLIFCSFVDNSFTQDKDKCQFKMKDTIILVGRNVITYNNYTTDTIFYNTSIYDKKTNKKIVKNLFKSPPKKSYSMVIVMGKLRPNASNQYIIPESRLMDYKVGKGTYLFETYFYHVINGDRQLLSKSDKDIYIK